MWLYRPERAWSYCHHPHITFFKGRFFAIWSNGRVDEDDLGQRVLLTWAEDFAGPWSPPAPLIDSQMGRAGELYDDFDGLWRVRQRTGRPVPLCEGSFRQTDDGVRFDRHLVLADEPHAIAIGRGGMHKMGAYGHPHTMVREGLPYVVVSSGKESVVLLRAPLPE